MAEVEVSVKSIRGTRLSEGTKDSEVVFYVESSMVERERRPGSLVLGFAIQLESQPALAKLAIDGTVRLEGEDEAIQSLVTVEDHKSVPPIFMRIYKRVYAIMYLLCGSLDIPYPSPGLLRVPHMVPVEKLADFVEESKTMSINPR